MAYVTIDSAINTMRQHDARYWELSANGSTSLLAECNEQDIDLEESLAQLEDAINSVESGTLKIKANVKSKAARAKGGNNMVGKYEFAIRIGSSRVNRVGGTDNLVLQLMNEKFELQRKFDNMERDHKHEEALRKLEEQGDPIVNRGLDVLTMFFGGKIQAPAPAPGMAGPGEDDQQTKQRILDALNRIIAVDPDFANTIEALAVLAETKPEDYNNYATMLKQMYGQTG